MMEDDQRKTLGANADQSLCGYRETYQLTARYLKLLIQGAAPESILATTSPEKLQEKY